MLKKMCLILFCVLFSSTAFAAFPINYSEQLDISKGQKVFKTQNNDITIWLSGVVRPMSPFNISFEFKDNNVKDITYSTNMSMIMGKFEYTPKFLGSRYGVSLTLPRCGSGRTMWYGKLNVTYSTGAKDEVIFFYNVK